MLRWLNVGHRVFVAFEWCEIVAGRPRSENGMCTLRGESGRVFSLPTSALQSVPLLSGAVYSTWDTQAPYEIGSWRHPQRIIAKQGIRVHYSLVDAIRHMRGNTDRRRGMHYLLSDPEE